jgi:hypothetical protein
VTRLSGEFPGDFNKFSKFLAALGGKKGKVGGKLGAVVEKKVMPVETDPKKLVNYVCGSNIFTKGEDVKVKNENNLKNQLAKFPFSDQTRQRISRLALEHRHRPTKDPRRARPRNEDLLAEAQANWPPTQQHAAEDQKILVEIHLRPSINSQKL